MQKIDFGVLSSVRQNWIQNAIGADFGLTAEDLYIEMPKVLARKVAAILDLEEAWHFTPETFDDFGDCFDNENIASLEAVSSRSWAPATSSLVGKIIFRVIILSKSDNGAEALSIANQARFFLDGLTLVLGTEAEFEATFRMQSNVVDFKKQKEAPRKVEQFYEALVHRRPQNANTENEAAGTSSNAPPSSSKKSAKASRKQRPARPSVDQLLGNTVSKSRR